MPNFISPDGNNEIWDARPDGYFTPEEWTFNQLSPQEQEKLASARKSEPILARLTEIDSESVRPLRAVAGGAATAFDTQKLARLDAEAAELRKKLQKL